MLKNHTKEPVLNNACNKIVKNQKESKLEPEVEIVSLENVQNTLSGATL